jgi:hypothetical protein
MGFTEILKSLTDLLAEVNKNENNVELKKVASALCSLKGEMKKQQKNARRDQIIIAILSAIGAFLIGYTLKYFF